MNLIRYVGLDLTKMLGRDVKHVLPKVERTPAARQSALRDRLATDGVLYAEVSVPDTSGALEIRADLRAKQVALSTSIHAPKEGRSKGRVSWLLRQLQEAPDALTIQARLGRGQSLAASLAKVRETPELLYPETPKEIRVFDLTLTRDMGVKKDASKGSFVDSVVAATQEFYTQVLQNLRLWKAAPPKVRRAESDEAEPAETVVGFRPEVAEALEAAQEEQEEKAREGATQPS